MRGYAVNFLILKIKKYFFYIFGMSEKGKFCVYFSNEIKNDLYDKNADMASLI